MAPRRKANTEAGEKVVAGAIPSSLALAAEGVVTGEDFARLMSALMTDIIEGTITTDASNAVCRAGGRLLQVVEMQYKYGSKAAEPRPAFKLVG